MGELLSEPHAELCALVMRRKYTDSFDVNHSQELLKYQGSDIDTYERTVARADAVKKSYDIAAEDTERWLELIDRYSNDEWFTIIFNAESIDFHTEEDEADIREQPGSLESIYDRLKEPDSQGMVVGHTFLAQLSSELWETTQTLAYADPQRARQLVGRLLESDLLGVACTGLSAMNHLTAMIGEDSVALWARALEHPESGVRKEAELLLRDTIREGQHELQQASRGESAPSCIKFSFPVMKVLVALQETDDA